MSHKTLYSYKTMTILKHRASNFIVFLVLFIELSNTRKMLKRYNSNKENERWNQNQTDGIEGKIVGGRPISQKAVPYSVQVFNQGAMCAGTILSSWAVITAAHCFDNNKNVLEMVVQIGSRYVYDFNANRYGIADVVIHNKYNLAVLFACDIALIFLDRPIEFSSNAKKAVLVNHKKWMNPRERNFTVIGWGWTQYGGPVSKKGLMTTRLRYVPSEECSKLHETRLTSDMFCLYGDGVRDTCKGDSGGGVFWHEMMVGVTSHGDGCAKKGKPSVYTNVHYFRNWIKREMLRYIDKNC